MEVIGKEYMILTLKASVKDTYEYCYITVGFLSYY